MSTIRTVEELRTVYKAPLERAVLKEMTGLDKHARAFLQRCPFVLIGSCAKGGRADVSPKGDQPGFVHALDDRTIAIPDRPGNNRLDTFENILSNPEVGLIFLIPGMNETLRINGKAEISTDAALLARFEYQRKLPISVMVVRTEEVYLHCAKAFLRSGLWDPSTFIERGSFPSFGAMMKDQIALEETAEELDRHLAERYKATLY
ncbi:pyridoxamine 5'-phosphate oxidase-like FMN-binding protein [Aureimonas sp. SA4125]|uniref:pyridoxamine 5'-phosphate oxidase family protein n=1 Tax=Aureimonas sp. SA4125 TaxID=2826993 RepID=UPI001CC40C82|nr:pyridoxamine 5'-phosphate oxidase family protein [Aureimonas sp. SA4125]BDA86507.1 pyridoxamine 5'-phosphate oxidase-like FMN-binding protein [Aureimonas sp. SA4125]